MSSPQNLSQPRKDALRKHKDKEFSVPGWRCIQAETRFTEASTLHPVLKSLARVASNMCEHVRLADQYAKLLSGNVADITLRRERRWGVPPTPAKSARRRRRAAGQAGTGGGDTESTEPSAGHTAAAVAPLGPAAPATATFHPFSRLPVELRLLIWEAAADAFPPCFCCVQILAIARQVPWGQAREWERRLGAAVPMDPAAQIMDESVGLWMACREARRVKERRQRATVSRLTREAEKTRRQEAIFSARGPPNGYFSGNFYNYCCGASMDIETQGRRMGRVNRSGLLYQELLDKADVLVRSLELHKRVLMSQYVPTISGSDPVQELRLYLKFLQDCFVTQVGMLVGWKPDLQLGYLLGYRE